MAAAQHYESTLDHDELILIGDFGGGTSDFSLLRVGPSIRKRGRTAADLLGNSGVGIAGDAFDAKIVRNLVSPALGSGSSARSDEKVLPAVPNWVYSKLEHWHHLSFLRTGSTMNMLNSTRPRHSSRRRSRRLIHLIKEDLGYELHRAVQNGSARCRWSRGTVSLLRRRDRDRGHRDTHRFRRMDRRGTRADRSVCRFSDRGFRDVSAEMSTWCFLRAARHLCRRCAGFSRRALGPTVSAPETSLPRWRGDWR